MLRTTSVTRDAYHYLPPQFIYTFSTQSREFEPVPDPGPY